jgi:hypothetical protein
MTDNSTRPASAPVSLAFERTPIVLDEAEIEVLHDVAPKIKQSSKYAQIAASIREIGIIEPPVVARHPVQSGRYLLLDGHLRLDVLRTNGVKEVACLLATDDEAFTYNKRISRLAAIQEHQMILKLIERNVPEARIARSLNIDISTLQGKARMLNGVCPEAIEILSKKQIAAKVFGVLRRMRPLRQIEVAELMVAMNRFTEGYARALLAATPRALLVMEDRPKAEKGLTDEQRALMERESAQLDREVKFARKSFGADHLLLVVARGYLRRLLENERVFRYLGQHRPEFLAEFRRIAESDAFAA